MGHAGLYTSVYVLFLITNPSILTMVSVLLAFAITADTFIGKLNDKVFANKEFTNEMDTRYHAFCTCIVVAQASSHASLAQLLNSSLNHHTDSFHTLFPFWLLPLIWERK